MSKQLIEDILSHISKIINSYEKLSHYENSGCTYEQIKKELQLLLISTEELSPLIKNLQNHKIAIQGLDTLVKIFKITYLPTLKIHLLYLKERKESNVELLKIQARLALTYLNVDGCVDNLRIIHAYLK